MSHDEESKLSDKRPGSRKKAARVIRKRGLGWGKGAAARDWLQTPSKTGGFAHRRDESAV